MLKKILVSLLLATTLLTGYLAYFPKKTNAAGQWYNQSPVEWFVKVYDTNNPTEIYGERYTAAQVQWVIYSLFSFPLTLIPGGPELVSCIFSKELSSECLEPVKSIINFIGDEINPFDEKQSSTGSVSDIASVVFAPRPISFITYLKDLGSRLNPVKTVHAQGFGYTVGGNVVLQLWKVSRNICYLLMTIVVVVMAFMIMFKVKTSPQTVITVQSALPKIAAALILITFSYAIAGFLIDLMYVVLGLLVSFIQSSGLVTWDWAKTFRSFTNDNILQMMLKYWIILFFGWLNSIFTSGALGTILALLFIIVVILSLILVIWWAIKSLIMLIKVYFSIIMLIVAAPFQMLLGAFMPGAGFGPWVKNMASNLAVYPVVAFMWFLAIVFVGSTVPSSLPEHAWFLDATMMGVDTKILQGATAWDPPFTTMVSLNASNPHISGVLLLFVSLVIISEIPKVDKLIKSAMQKREYEFGSAFGEITQTSYTIGKAAEGYPDLYKRLHRGTTPSPTQEKIANILSYLQLLGRR